MRPLGIAVMTIACLFAGIASRAEASARAKNEEGNRLYKEKKYGEAMKRYTEAQLEAPDSPQLHYNLGNVLFRQGQVDKAREEYRRALASADASLDPRAVYNLGNTFFTQKQYQEAVSAYQRTLKLSPKDMDAKRNLELALLRLKQQQQQQQDSSQSKDQNKDKKQPGEKQKPDPSSGQEKKDPQSQKQDSKDQQAPSPRPQKGDLTKEEAERILNALQEDEKANLKRRLQAEQQESKDVEEDW
ncbi:MAG TPA: tetratricopeptide repeat protein [Candidatus Polarisedimenticolia bacterium]|nr:tetratricopeptide repeat protein [Candidatus Polarisedimenticolia bacterium]